MDEPQDIFKQLFDLSEEPCILADHKGNIKLANNKACQLYAYEKGELVGKNIKKVVHAEFHNDFGKHKPGTETAVSYVEKSIELKKNGTAFPAEIHWKPIIWNETTHVMAIVYDVSENIATLEKLKNSEEKYKLLAENIIDVIWILTADLKISYMSPSIERLTGFTPEEIMAQTLEELTTPESMIIVLDLIDMFFSYLRDGQPDKESKRLEIEQVCKDGSTIWTEAVVTPIFDNEDNFQFFLGVSRDISDRKATQLENKQLKSQLELQLNRMPIGVIVWDKNSKIESMNPASEKIFGFAEAEVKGTRFFDKVVPPDLHPKIKKVWEDYKTSDETIHVVNKNITKEKKHIICKWSNTPLKSQEGKLLGAVSMIQDITKEKENEQELKNHKDNLEDIVRKRTEEIEKQAKKLHDSQIALTFLLEDVNETRFDLEAANSKLDAVNKELEAFSYSVSHDLRAPLNRMDGFSKALLDDYSDKLGARGVHYLNRIRASSQHMSTLINNILELSRISKKDIQKKEINISLVITNILNELVESAPERKATISVQKGMFVKADQTLIEVVLRNLLENSWKFCQKKEKTEITCGIINNGNQKTLFIKDNGVGFNMKYYDQLFQPFRRLHSESDFVGTGIGLATVLRIINRHKGKIWAESEIDKGTTFFLVL